MKDKVKIDKIIKHWSETSDDDLQTMKQLFQSKSYHWALFIGHISTEKIIKALFVKIHEKHPPRIHNLYRLAELCNLSLTDQYADWLDTITTFNIKARYDDYKKEFYNLCNKEFTKLWISRIKEIQKWIKKML